MLLKDRKADTVGIVGSLLCLIHCLLLPFLVFGGLLQDEAGTHTAWVDYLFILLAVGSVFFATRQSEANYLKVMMWITVSWFSVSILLHGLFKVALYSSMAASILLVVLHSIHFKQHQQIHHTRKAKA